MERKDQALVSVLFKVKIAVLCNPRELKLFKPKFIYSSTTDKSQETTLHQLTNTQTKGDVSTQGTMLSSPSFEGGGTNACYDTDKPLTQ